MDSVSTDQIAHFQRRLAETIAWCTSQDWSFQRQSMEGITWHSLKAPGKGLRTGLLRPPEITDNVRAIFKERLPLEEQVKLLAIDRAEKKRQWQQNVEQLATKRAALLQAQNLPTLQVVPPLTGGCLLAFSPEESTGDGAAEFVTNGFFDSDNVPAWDTWLMYVADDHLLLSWVPDSLFEVVEAGIDVNPEECIRWATDLDTPFIRQLKQTGLLS